MGVQKSISPNKIKGETLIVTRLCDKNFGCRLAIDAVVGIMVQ